jgi:hypothetical protein
MKTWIIAILFLFLTASVAHAGGLKFEKKVREYLIRVEIDRNPLIIGDNDIQIDIKDDSGRSITDAEVLVNYYMPPMPRMVPMNYKTKADLSKDKYTATLNIIMVGPWYIRIIIDRAGEIATIKFNVDAQ